MKFMKILFAALCLLTLSASCAHALVTATQAVPDQRNIAYSPNGTTMTVVWRIDRTTAGGPVDLRSNPGRLVVGNLIVNTPARRKIYSGNPATLTFIETVTVPQRIMRLALETQSGQFLYQRDFADDPPANTFSSGEVEVHVTGGMGGPLGLSEVTLQFDNGATYTTAHRDDPLRAQARIQSNGAGQLAAVWEVNDGDNATFFRPLRTINVSLTGQRMVTVESPPLPTSADGRRNVRFRVISPPGSDIKPVITYYITGAGSRGPPLMLNASLPSSNATVAEGTKFRWTGAKNAAAYRLQILDMNNNPVASQLVRGTETGISAFVLSQLQGPATYQWRITALNAEGEVIGASLPRVVKVKGR